MTFTYRPAVAEDIAACIDLRGKTRENAVAVARLATLGVTHESWSRDFPKRATESDAHR
jgi:hypothetical protein